jgi:hypothetical protein
MELTFVGEGIETEEIIVVYEGQTLFDAIAVLLPKTGIVAEEILVLIDEEDAAADLQGYAAHPGHMGKRHHIHRRNCNIDVIVTFDGRHVSRTFPSWTKVKAVLEWATAEFPPGERCPAGSSVALKGNVTPLPDWQRIGALLQHPEKDLDLDLLKFVEVTVDRKPKRVLVGEHGVQQFKADVGVDPSRELNEVVDGVFTPLSDSGTVTIKGCEIFVSQVRSGSSS